MSLIPTPSTVKAAPLASQAMLQAVHSQLGSVPNLFRLVSTSPETLEGYVGLMGALGKGSLPAATRERIALAIAEINGCSYCLSAHSYLGRNLAMNSGFYLMGGIGSVDFAGDNHLAINLGAGYRVLPTDWLAIHIGVMDRVFDSDLLGENKVTNNIETLLSATVFF